MVIAFYSNGMQCSRDKPLLFTSILRTSRIQVKLIFIHCRLKSSSYFQRYPSNRGIPTLTVPYTPCVSLAHFSTLFHSAQYTHTHTCTQILSFVFRCFSLYLRSSLFTLQTRHAVAFIHNQRNSERGKK